MLVCPETKTSMTAIRTNGLAKRYSGEGRRDSEITAIDGLDLVVKEDEVFGLVAGPDR
jgi:ABC-type multidrug transport system ATPase subunit